MVGCLVNHSYEHGEFCLQIPISPKVESSENFKDHSKVKKMIMEGISPDLEISESDIKV
jgi:hypothetical protein